MTIDESKEREAFEAWYVMHAFNVRRDPPGCRDSHLQLKAWLARAAQPVRVSREAVCAALVAQGWDVPEDVDDQHALDCFCNAIRTLNIEVTDK